MTKKIFLLVAFTAYLLANGLGLNGSLNTFSLPDQFGKMHTVDNKIKTIVVSFEKGTGSDVNRFLKKADKTTVYKIKDEIIKKIVFLPSDKNLEKVFE